MLEYYLHINPDKLTDEQWGEKFAQLNDIREKEAEANKVSQASFIRFTLKITKNIKAFIKIKYGIISAP